MRPTGRTEEGGTIGSYITAAEIVTYTGTILTTAEIDAMIDDAEDEVEETLDVLGATPSTSNALLKAAVRSLVLISILQRYRMDGTKPKTLTVGSTTLSDDVDANIEFLEGAAQRKMDTFVSLQGDLDADLEETIVRVDHEMPSYNLDQSKVREYHDRADETSNQDTDL